ncbi:aliphatic sulfonate ABC transporter substrate-binding protein [Nocardia sp. R16R-3T]
MRPTIVLAAVAATVVALLSGCAEGEKSGAAGPGADEVRLDYAYYNPLSLVIRDQHLLEKSGAKVSWVFSAGSNKANESLRADAIDVNSTAGSAALLAKANGTPLQTISVYSKPEWTALVVAKNSPITSVAELKGKKIAATKGTDAYFTLLQALQTAGLTAKDVEVTNLQHADGKTALERGDVDAWAGLDPYMAQTRQEQGSRLLYRNANFQTYGVLNARADFIAQHPDRVQAVVNAYEQARVWALAHPNELAQLLATESKTSLDVAEETLERTVLKVDPVPGESQRAVLTPIVPIIVADGDVRSKEAADAALAALFEPKFAQQQAIR